MTRPPVGSTGTLAELQVEPGDKYKHLRTGEIYRAEFCDGKLTNRNVRDGAWGIAVACSKQEYRLISRANPDQPAHIITHEGRQYDLTALETPFGLLPEPVQVALDVWPHGVEMMTYRGQMIECNFPDMKGKRGAVWRAIPAPTETRVQCYRGEAARGYGAAAHGTCIKRPDGSIDWQSWEPDA